MSISLGGITLPDLTPDHDYLIGDSGIKSEFVESRGSTPLIWEQERFFKLLDLVGGERTGWVEYSVLTALMELAKGQLDSNAFYNLTYDVSYQMRGSDGTLVDASLSKTLKVRFRNWDQPVIEATPLVDVLIPISTTLYNNVRIKLVEILE